PRAHWGRKVGDAMSASWQKAVVWTLGMGVAGVLVAGLVHNRRIREDWEVRGRDFDQRGEQNTPLRLVAELERTRPPDPEAVPDAPPINGVVEVVDNDQKLVVLSVGRNQKVREGYTFTVYRGDRFVAKVKVVKVFDDLAGAKIVFTNENESIQV